MKAQSGKPQRACGRTTRYKTEDSARAHHRARHGSHDPVACEHCGGWHLVKRDAAAFAKARERVESERAARVAAHLAAVPDPKRRAS